MTDEIRYRLLDEPLLSVADTAGRGRAQLSLPELYAALVRGTVGGFPALRPHQRHVWHAFLVQIGALALHGAGLTETPNDAAEWRRLLLALTPKDPDGAAWSLVTPHARPALLQPPTPGGDVSVFKKEHEKLTPDALDMLVTANNHELKRGVIHNARPEHWIYALVSLQTQEGVYGSGKYGISRMNKGYGNRPGFGIEHTSQGPGGRLRRDIHQLVTLRARILGDYSLYPSDSGIGLVWLDVWDGSTSLSCNSLDPYYVEVCRRVRMSMMGGLHALTTGSATSRIDAKALKGRTGDPWTPLVIDDEGGRKALTLGADGFTYKRLVPLLFPTPGDPDAPIRARLQEWAADDADSGLDVLARAIVRGQGETQGLHERRVPVTKAMRPFLGPEVASDEGARVASERVKDVGWFAGRVLYAALMTVFTAAPSDGERKRDDDTAKARAGAALAPFDRQVDATFFADLDAELGLSGDPDAQQAIRVEWLLRLRDLGRDTLAVTLASAPTAAMRHYRTHVRARSRFEAAFRRHFGHRVTVATDTPSP